MEKFLAGRVRVEVGDITTYETEAIVNAANNTLLGGGGVDGAIHRKGGSQIHKECEALRRDAYPNGLPTGQAVMTGAGHLPCRYVIHTVGPLWRGGEEGEDDLLRSAYENVLLLACHEGIESVAFPSLSTGAYGFPKDRAAAIVVGVLRSYKGTLPSSITLVFSCESDKRILFRTFRSSARERA